MPMQDLEQNIADLKACHRQELRKTLAKFNGLLQSDLLPLIRDIHDAATMTPVRTHVILDRVQSIKCLISKETGRLERML